MNIQNINDAIMNSVLDLVNSQQEWTGTMTDLAAKIKNKIPKDFKSEFPKTPQTLRVSVNKIVSRLRARGVSVKFNKSHGTRLATFKIK